MFFKKFSIDFFRKPLNQSKQKPEFFFICRVLKTTFKMPDFKYDANNLTVQ
jgi:hypothetical protein